MANSDSLGSSNFTLNAKVASHYFSLHLLCGCMFVSWCCKNTVWTVDELKRIFFSTKANDSI